ncbi:MAG: hypothetical protein FWC68_00080 [Oscillospiraceae bacterium]|nr:hypothetical protein [Oscillospiraceae bacterium]
MWYLQSGKESDVVISSRVRLARNLKETPFVNRVVGAHDCARTRCITNCTKYNKQHRLWTKINKAKRLRRYN